MTTDDLAAELENLKKIVDMLCVSVGGWAEEDHQEIYKSCIGKISYMSRNILREAAAKRRLEQLDNERKILMEDFPSLFPKDNK